MPDQPNSSQPDGFPVGGVRISGFSAGDADTSLRAEPAPTPDVGLHFPHGAMVAFARSGGLRFRSNGFVITHNGWLIPQPGSPGRMRHLAPARCAVLMRQLAQAGLGRITAPASPSRPDGFSYTIVARVRGRPRTVEFDAHAVPVHVVPLVRSLRRLLVRATSTSG